MRCSTLGYFSADFGDRRFFHAKPDNAAAHHKLANGRSVEYSDDDQTVFGKFIFDLECKDAQALGAAGYKFLVRPAAVAVYNDAGRCFGGTGETGPMGPGRGFEERPWCRRTGILSEAENWGYRGTTRFAIKQEYGHHFIRAEF